MKQMNEHAQTYKHSLGRGHAWGCAWPKPLRGTDHDIGAGPGGVDSA